MTADTHRSPLLRAALAATLLVLPPLAEAVEVSLVASAFNQPMPDGSSHRMWGFAPADAGFVNVGTPSSPGPVLSVPAGDTTLVIHLRNDLPVPVSIVIPALPAALAPERTTDALGRSRVTSFTATTAPGAVGTYTFGARPGTFLYHSGTNPSVQVQMGLFGAVRAEAAPGEAYPGVGYDTEQVLVLSELDPALHAAVRDGTYGTPAYPTSMRYSPRWFLVNGAVAPAIPPVAATQGDRVLLRLVNAGFEAHVPQLLGAPLTLVGEDGHRLPWPRVEDSAYLPAGKTVDAIVVAPSAGRYALYDRRFFVSNPRLGAGGMATALEVSAPAGAPTSVDDAFAATEDVLLTVALPGVLANDLGTPPLEAELVAAPASGTLALAADGSLTYAPPPDANGPVTFTYRARAGALAGNVATATITIAPVNDVPIANADAASVEEGRSVTVQVLANDVDVDGDELFVQSVTPPANGAVAVLDGGQAVSYTPSAGFSGTDGFSYVATDGLAASAPAAVTVTVIPRVNQPPIATDDYATTLRNRAVTVAVLANDRDPDGTLVPGSVITTAPTRGGTVVVNADGTVRYTPRPTFRGTDTFTYTVADAEGARSNAATVRVNVR